jgi:hypothetical protein
VALFDRVGGFCLPITARIRLALLTPLKGGDTVEVLLITRKCAQHFASGRLRRLLLAQTDPEPRMYATLPRRYLGP